MNPQYKPTFLLLFFLGTILTVAGIVLVYVLQSNTTGLVLLGMGFVVHFFNLVLYYRKGRVSEK